jgi:hypothetical protein
MKNQKCVMLCLFVLFIIIISGCSPSTSTRSTTDYRKGTNGIVISFAEGTPPSRVYELSGFDIIVKIANKGAYDNPNGKIFITGYDPAALTFNPKVQDIPAIQGSSQYLPGGGYDTVVFRADNVNVVSGDVYKPTLMLSSCFYYKTLATPNVCIASSPTELIKNKVCVPQTVTMASQGAPVAVTKVAESLMEGAANFVITIKNVGGGNVVIPDPEKFEKCPSTIEYTDIDAVDYEVKIKSIGVAKCTPEKRVKLVDGEGTISCVFDTAPGRSGYDAAQNSYITPLEITLSYAYNTNVKKDLEIARIPGTKQTT